MKYKFVVFEGIDCSGKTTLINNIKAYLKEKEYFFTKEPGNTDFKEYIYPLLSLLKEADEPITEYLLFAAERTHHIKTKIIPALQENKTIISDRFIDSSIVYQSECKKKLIEYIFKKTNYGIHPSLTFFCQIEPKIAQQRMKKRTNNNFLDQKYEKKLKHFDKKYQKLYKNREDVIVLDMTQKIEDLTKICIEKIQLIHANNINAIL